MKETDNNNYYYALCAWIVVTQAVQNQTEMLSVIPMAIIIIFIETLEISISYRYCNVLLI